MIIWQGFGILGVLIPILGYALGVVIATGAGANSLAANTWAGPAGMLLGAVAAWFLAKRLDQPGRTLIDPQTGQQVVLRRKNTFFFIPMKYVAIAMGFVALVMIAFHGGPK